MGKRVFDYIPNYVVFDLETTGIDCKKDEVIEISAIKVRDGAPVEEFTTLVNPGISIPFGATAVNGISDDMVADAPTFAYVLSEFMNFIGTDVLVGHNIHQFDMKFIRRDAARFLDTDICNDYLDTLTMAKQVLSELEHKRLVDLAQHYGIPQEGAHRALNDCYMNYKVFECMAKEPPKVKEIKGGMKKCPQCGQQMRRRSGRFGEFWGCLGYPQCRHTENI